MLAESERELPLKSHQSIVIWISFKQFIDLGIDKERKEKEEERKGKGKEIILVRRIVGVDMICVTEGKRRM